MNKLKGIFHDFIHVFCISCFCFSYLCLRAPTPIKANDYSNLPWFMIDGFVSYYNGSNSFNYEASYYQNKLKELFSKKDIDLTQDYLLQIDSNDSMQIYINPVITLFSSTQISDSKLYYFNSRTNYEWESSSKKTTYISVYAEVYRVFGLQNNFVTYGSLHYSDDFKDYIYESTSDSPYYSFYISKSTFSHSISLQQLHDWAVNGTVPDLTPSTGYCTFTWFQDYDNVDDLLQAIAVNPANQGLNPYVIVSSSKQGSSSCEEKGTKNLYNTGSFRIVNGMPEFMYTMPPCKDEQIPTADNVFYYGTEVPETGQEQYHAVCTYDSKTVYEYKEGSSGGGLIPDEPDYGIFQPLVDLLNSIFAPITALLNLFFGNFSTSLETLFKSLFVPSETYFNDKWNGFYSKFNQKFPFISDIKPLADSFISMATNSNTSRPDFTVTLPEFAGGQTVQIVDLTWFDNYRSMIHAGILFFVYTTFILRLPKKTASAIGGTTS